MADKQEPLYSLFIIKKFNGRVPVELDVRHLRILGWFYTSIFFFSEEPIRNGGAGGGKGCFLSVDIRKLPRNDKGSRRCNGK